MKKKLIAIITVFAVIFTGSLFTSCAPQLGVYDSNIDNADLPETKSMELNFNIVPNKDQRLILDAIGEDILYQVGEYNIDNSVSSMSLYSLFVQDGKWNKKELLRDEDLEYNKNIGMFLGYYKKNNKIFFSIDVNKTNKDVPGQSFIVGEQLTANDFMDHYFSSNIIEIEKNKVIPIALKIHGSSDDLNKIRHSMENNLDKYANDLDYFYKNPNVLSEYNIHSYQFIAIAFH